MLKKLPIPRLTLNNQRNFWKKVDKKSKDECWLWRGFCNIYGYGRFQINGKSYQAPRVVLAIEGKRNNKLETCHSCNNRSCVNPNHLRFGTRKENNHDKIHAGTDNKGSRNGEAKLLETDIPIIRKLRQTYSCREIGNLFGVSKSVISMIMTNKIWRHVTRMATDQEIKAFLRN